MILRRSHPGQLSGSENIKFNKIKYSDLNSRQKETYNFQKVSAVLADYGFACIPLNDDWQGADFIAQHISGDVYLKVQLKGRLTFDKKYQDKDLFVCFPYKSEWYLYPHDELLNKLKDSKMFQSQSWKNGHYTIGTLSKTLIKNLSEYKL